MMVSVLKHRDTRLCTVVLFPDNRVQISALRPFMHVQECTELKKLNIYSGGFLNFEQHRTLDKTQKRERYL